MIKQVLTTVLLLVAAIIPAISQTTSPYTDQTGQYHFSGGSSTTTAPAGEWETLESSVQMRKNLFAESDVVLSMDVQEDYTITATDRVCGEIQSITYPTGAIRWRAMLIGSLITSRYRTRTAAKTFIEEQCEPVTAQHPGLIFASPAYTTITGTTTTPTP